MAVVWADSADKHGIAHEDALHAILHARYNESAFDKPRVPGHARPNLYIGPARSGTPLLEVMVEAVPPRDLVIFHVMIARDKHLRRMKATTVSEKTDYAALSEWAENDMLLDDNSPTALHGRSAATKGRAALEAALGGPGAVHRAVHGGRPPLDPGAAPGQHARSRTIRLTTDLSDRLDALAAAQHRRPSDVMREALSDYLDRRRVG